MSPDLESGSKLEGEDLAVCGVNEVTVLGVLVTEGAEELALLV